VPIHAGNEGSGAVEKILAVLQIKDGKARVRVAFVLAGEIDDQIPFAGKKA